MKNKEKLFAIKGVSLNSSSFNLISYRFMKLAPFVKLRTPFSISQHHNSYGFRVGIINKPSSSLTFNF